MAKSATTVISLRVPNPLLASLKAYSQLKNKSITDVLLEGARAELKNYNSNMDIENDETTILSVMDEYHEKVEESLAELKKRIYWIDQNQQIQTEMLNTMAFSQKIDGRTAGTSKLYEEAKAAVSAERSKRKQNSDARGKSKDGGGSD